MSEPNDFGFSFVDENPEKLKTENIDKGNEIADLQARIDDILEAIEPLLTNLSSNPEKDTILWPNRVKVIDDFRKRLQKIAKGK